MRHLKILLLVSLFLSGVALAGAAPQGTAATTIYLPLLNTPPGPPPRIANAPYFNVADVDSKFAELGTFWFGQVTPSSNYADVRVGYNSQELYVHVAAFDRRIWYPTSPGGQDLATWDAVELLIDTGGAAGAAPRTSSYRLLAAFNGGGNRDAYERAFRGDGSAWKSSSTAFSTTPGWRGDALNDNGDDKGWAMAYRIPFSSLGLSGPPADGTIWALGVRLFDRDGSGATYGPTQIWPPQAQPTRPSSWGGLRFGLPRYLAPPASNSAQYTIRHRLNGVSVPDGAVGGGTTCGGGVDYWSQWGNLTYYMLPDEPGTEQGDFNIQNQSDISDWPCYSKYYITFPLSTLPSGKVVVGARLVLHQFGNANPPEAERSLIEVSIVDADWSEATLSWNNAPLAVENVARAWVDPLLQHPGFPGVAREWDVSAALARAYAAGQPLRLAMYSPDNNYHSGKYFISADTGDWNAVGRPTLIITLGDR